MAAASIGAEADGTEAQRSRERSDPRGAADPAGSSDFRREPLRHPGVPGGRDDQLVGPAARRLAGEVGDRGGHVLRGERRPRAGGRPSGCASVRMMPSATSSATWTPAGRSSWASDWVNARAPNWAAAQGPRPGIPRRADPPETWISVPEPRRASAAPPSAQDRPRGGQEAGDPRLQAVRAEPSTIGPPPKLWSRGHATSVALTTRSRPPRSRSARARASATSAWSDASPRTPTASGWASRSASRVSSERATARARQPAASRSATTARPTLRAPNTTRTGGPLIRAVCQRSPAGCGE